MFCVDADAKDNDFIAVIDVNPDSAHYGTIVHTVDLGSKGNETHHWGYTDDRTRIWAGGLLSSRIWILDVATDPLNPLVGYAAAGPRSRRSWPSSLTSLL